MAEPNKEDVAIRAPDGTVGHVARKDLDQALDAGSEEVTPEVVREATLQSKYGGAGGIAKAAGAGVARGLTLGASDKVAQWVGGQELADELENLKEANPYTSLASELGGAIAPTLLSGGAGAVGEANALARGVRAVGILPRGAAALGEGAAGVARGLVGEGATTLGGRVLQHALPMAAQGAAEGAIYGAGSAISESALGPDHELTAEKVMAGAAKGALFGGGVGGALGTVGGLSSSLRHVSGSGAGAEMEALAARHIGEDAAPGLGRALKAENAADFAAEKIAASAKDPQQAQLLREHWRQRNANMFELEDKLNANVRDFTKHLDAVVEAETKVNSVAYGESKAKEMAKLVDGTNWRAARENALEVWQKGKDRLELLEADPTRGGGGPGVSRVSKLWEKLDGQIQGTAMRAVKDKTAWSREMFTTLDDLKRAVGKQAGMGMHPNMRNAAQKEFFDLYHEIQPVLENEGIWGKAALAQKEINQSASQLYGTRGEFAGKFLRQGFDSVGGNAIDRANPAGIQAHLKDLLSPGSDLNHEALTRYMRDVEGFASSVEKHYAGGKAEAKTIAEMKSSLATMRDTIDRTAKESALANQLKRARSEEVDAGIGGVLGLATDFASRKFKTLDRLAGIERGVKRIDEGLRGGVKAFLSPSGGGLTNAELARSVKLSPPPKAPNAGPTLVDGPKSRYATRAAAIAALASNPDAQAAHMARVTGDMADHAPNTTAALGMVTSRGTAYLASQLPGGHIDPRSLTPHLETKRVSDIEADQWLRRYEAAENPLGAIEDMRKGKLSREAVETIKVVYPKIYQQLQGEVMTQLAERTTPLAYAQKVQLGLLLDIPTDATMDMGFRRAIAATYGPNPAAENDNGVDDGMPHPPPANMKPINVSSMYGGALDTIEANRRE